MLFCENDGFDRWGHYEKQSSFWSNNKACLVTVENNIAFNAPRAGINFNDG